MGALKATKPSRGRWCVVQLDGAEVWTVLRPDDTVYGTYGSHPKAIATASARQREDDQAARRMTRACMCCRKPFESEGIHNRLCSCCRGQGADAWHPHGIAQRSGRPR